MNAAHFIFEIISLLIAHCENHITAVAETAYASAPIKSDFFTEIGLDNIEF